MVTDNSLISLDEICGRSSAYFENDKKAHDIFQRLHNYLHAENTEEFIENYGGIYLNKNGNLVVKIVHNSSGNDELISEVKKYGATYEFCSFSYNELLHTMESINNYLMSISGKKNTHQIVCAGLYIKDNRVKVGLANHAQAIIEAFKKDVCNSDCIEFFKSDLIIKEDVNINCGYPITGGSVAYRAKKNGDIGIVTAAHVITSVGQSVVYNNVNIASCVVRQNSGSVDGAFCKITNSEYVPTNYIGSDTSKVLLTSIYEPEEGKIVNFVGKVNNGAGEVLSTKYSYVSSSGVSYTNLVTAGYVSEPGDSGGLVYTYMSNGELRETTGVNHGHANHSDGTYAYAIFSKASSINSALSIERY